MKYSIISITTDGDQLNGHGYSMLADARRHINERVRLSRFANSTRYESFILVGTASNDGNPETFVARLLADGVHADLDSRDALTQLAGYEADEVEAARDPAQRG